MAEDLTKEQYWQLYHKLPKELQNLIFAEQTAKDIYDICARNDIDTALVPEVAKRVGDVLLGIVPPDQFQSRLEKDLKLGTDKADRVAKEINRFIFYPVRSRLEEMHKAPAPTPEKSKKEAPEKPKPPRKADVYREQVE